VLLAHAASILGVVQQQVGELSALLDEVLSASIAILPSKTLAGIPTSSLSTRPESLKLNVWSKSLASR